MNDSDSEYAVESATVDTGSPARDSFTTTTPAPVADAKHRALFAHTDLLRQMQAAESKNAPPGCVADIPLGATRVPLTLRLFEIGVAGIALIFAAPVMALIAIIIRIGSPGPALFHQARLGLNGESFKFVKFRSFYADARERFPHLYAYRYDENEIRTMQFKRPDDARITPQGRWLRACSLDELPNLFLVLTGKLALVGPRPQIPEMLPYYQGIMLERFSVRPGLTDLAHVSGRSSLSFYETSAMDVAYVRNKSWRLDLWILWRTLILVIKRDGAF